MRTIALLTDFGWADTYAGIMKGVILNINPDVNIVDLAHGIHPQDVLQAAVKLKSASPFFPPKTVFVSIVDPGVGSGRQAIIVKTAKHIFLAPDNGLLSLVLEQEKNFEIYSITNNAFFLKPVSNTFHGRDIFAPVAAHLSKGVEPTQFGPRVEECVRIKLPVPRIDRRHQRVEGDVIDIDVFGNLITNIELKHAAFLGETIAIHVGGKTINKLSSSYAQVRTGELLAIWGSRGYLEVSVNHGSAREVLGVPKGEKVVVAAG